MADLETPGRRFFRDLGEMHFRGKVENTTAKLVDKFVASLS